MKKDAMWKPRHRLENNIKMDFENELEGLGYIRLFQHRDQWQAFVTEM
jgi:hypothetical protein